MLRKPLILRKIEFSYICMFIVIICILFVLLLSACGDNNDRNNKTCIGVNVTCNQNDSSPAKTPASFP